MLLSRFSLSSAHSSLRRQPSPAPKQLCYGVTIGNFDGVHLGHQELFKTLNRALIQAATTRGQCPHMSLLTFYPHPRRYFDKVRPSRLNQHPEYWPLSRFRSKWEQVRAFGFDRYCALRFDEALCNASPEEFCARILKDYLQASVVVVGHDWCFGKGRSGNPHTLAEIGERLGFSVHVVGEQLVDGRRVSSGRVRRALAQGDVVEVGRCLGRPFTIEGRVERGRQLGRTLGFPTANILTRFRQLPAHGVYATEVQLEDKCFSSVTNVGVRPTVDGHRLTVETHILDFEPVTELYGSHLKLGFISRLREEKRFPSVEALRQAIAADVGLARELFKRQPKQ